MKKYLYYALITLGFSVVSIPVLYNVIATHHAFNNVSSNGIKNLLLFFVCITEISYIKKTTPVLVGGVATFGLLLGRLFKITHWEFGFLNGNTLLLLSGLLILITLIISAFIEKNKGVLHYILFFYIAERTCYMVFHRNDELFYWVDVVTCAVIALTGCVYFFRKKFKGKA